MCGFSVWGSPCTPEFWGAFNVKRGPRIRDRWRRIPAGTDIVLTHGPARGERDRVFRGGENVGCHDLYTEVRAHPRRCGAAAAGAGRRRSRRPGIYRR